ncbi:MAG: tetratricopeptide repeat protein, partial [Bacteroidota bacterium]
SSQVHFMLGLVHTKMRNYDKAIGAFDQSLSLDGNNAETLINRGTVKYYQHQLEAAEIDLKAAMQIDPLEPNTYNAMSIIETERGDFQKALELVNQALGLEKDQAYFLNNRGYIYLNLNELEKAKADIDRSIIKDPNNGWAYRNKGYYYYLLGEYEKAVPLYDQASKLDAFIDKIYLFKSLNYQKLGKPTEACENFQKAKENKEDVAELVGYCL